MKKQPRSLFKSRKRSGAFKVEPNRAEPYDPNNELYIATHEAGHAVAAVMLGRPLESVDLNHRRRPDGTLSVGFTDSGRIGFLDVAGKGEDAAMPILISALAGPMAESMVNPRILEFGSYSGDITDARRVAAVAICDAGDFVQGDRGLELSSDVQRLNAPRIQALWSLALDTASGFVEMHRDVIQTVAAELRKKRRLSGKEVADVVARMPVAPA